MIDFESLDPSLIADTLINYERRVEASIIELKVYHAKASFACNENGDLDSKRLVDLSDAMKKLQVIVPLSFDLMEKIQLNNPTSNEKLKLLDKETLRGVARLRFPLVLLLESEVKAAHEYLDSFEPSLNNNHVDHPTLPY